MSPGYENRVVLFFNNTRKLSNKRSTQQTFAQKKITALALKELAALNGWFQQIQKNLSDEQRNDFNKKIFSPFCNSLLSDVQGISTEEDAIGEVLVASLSFLPGFRDVTGTAMLSALVVAFFFNFSLIFMPLIVLGVCLAGLLVGVSIGVLISYLLVKIDHVVEERALKEEVRALLAENNSDVLEGFEKLSFENLAYFYSMVRERVKHGVTSQGSEGELF